MDKVKRSVLTRGDNGTLSKSCIWVESNNFYRANKKGIRRSKSDSNTSSPFLIIGFDTEYKTPSNPLQRWELEEGYGRNKILSYQVYCKLYDPSLPDQPEWGGICFPQDGEVDNRLSLSDILTFAVWKGVQSGVIESIPRMIYLVGHFTRADFPAFADFKNLTQMMSSVRNTFLSIDGHIEVKIPCEDGDEVPVKVLVRDTMLLTPAASKGLKALGELVGQPKIDLDPDPVKDQFYKENMDILLEEKPDLFDRYALNDSVICVRYADRLIEQSRTLLGTSKLPATLTSIGVDLLWKSWAKSGKSHPLDVLGKEEVYERQFNKRFGYFENRKRAVDLQEVSWHLPLATECVDCR